MTVRKIQTDIKGLTYAEQVSWAAGDPGAGYTALKAFNISLAPTQEILVPESQRPEACIGPDKGTAAGKGGTLTFSIYLRGSDAAAESEFIALAKNCGFTLTDRAGTSAGKVESATTSTIVANTSEIGDYIVGDVIMVESSGVEQMRWVSAVDDDTPGAGDTTLTIEPNWATTPSAADDFYPVDTLNPTVGEPTKYMTFQLFEGQGTDSSKWTLTGCAGTWKILSAEANNLPVVEFTYMIDSWTLTDSTATTYTADSFEETNPMLGSALYITDDAVVTRSIAFDPGIKLQPYVATSGTNGRAGWVYEGVEPVLEIDPYHDSTWYSKLSGESLFSTAFECVKDEDNGWFIYVHRCQVTGVEATDINGLIGSKPTILCRNAGTSGLKVFTIAVTGV